MTSVTLDIGIHEVCVRVGVRYVITKFSRMDSLPNFLTHGAPLAHFTRESYAISTILPDTLSLSFSFSLWWIRLSPNKQDERINGWLIIRRRMDDNRNSPTIKFWADLFSAHRYPSIEFKKRLELASINSSNIWISKAYVPANKMNCM